MAQGEYRIGRWGKAGVAPWYVFLDTGDKRAAPITVAVAYKKEHAETVVEGLNAIRQLERARATYNAVLDEKDKAQRALAQYEERRFPIMHGPSVPWSVMAPHESQADRNHGQSLEELARRGGLDPSEAWCVVRGKKWPGSATPETQDEYRHKWLDFAERHNTMARELKSLRQALNNPEGDSRWVALRARAESAEQALKEARERRRTFDIALMGIIEAIVANDTVALERYKSTLEASIKQDENAAEPKESGS